jgi:PIN domain nuclease of toxin-antitoxin system
MKLLLDTHALIWWLADDQRLGARARSLIADPANPVLVSVVSLWEIVIKVKLGKLEADIGAVERALVRNNFLRLAITPAHLAALIPLPQHHRDPFDHLLMAQATVEDALMVSDNENIARYPVRLQTCHDGDELHR